MLNHFSFFRSSQTDLPPSLTIRLKRFPLVGIETRINTARAIGAFVGEPHSTQHGNSPIAPSILQKL